MISIQGTIPATEVEEGASIVQGQPEVQSEFKASMGYRVNSRPAGQLGKKCGPISK